MRKSKSQSIESSLINVAIVMHVAMQKHNAHTRRLSPTAVMNVCNDIRQLLGGLTRLQFRDEATSITRIGLSRAGGGGER